MYINRLILYISNLYNFMGGFKLISYDLNNINLSIVLYISSFYVYNFMGVFNLTSYDL